MQLEESRLTQADILVARLNYSRFGCRRPDLTIPVYSGRLFHWDCLSMRGWAAREQLVQHRPIQRKIAEQIWKDDAKQGFWVESEETTEKHLFWWTGCEMDCGGRRELDIYLSESGISLIVYTEACLPQWGII